MAVTHDENPKHAIVKTAFCLWCTLHNISTVYEGMETRSSINYLQKCLSIPMIV